jgi:hypothetical protein
LVAAAVVSLSAAVVALAAARAGEDPRPRALIVDQLAITDPNPAFVERAGRELQQAGYDVKYVPPERVTVAFYRDLPRLDYDLIILRSHSAAFVSSQDGPLVEDRGVALFTNEPYDPRKYTEDLRRGVISRGRYNEPGSAAFFAVDAAFVRERMEGDFDGATIILMGCAGLRTSTLATALVQRGVRRFVSWDDDVTAVHTDDATEALLRNLAADPAAVDVAVAATMSQVGPDPLYGARLLAFP